MTQLFRAAAPFAVPGITGRHRRTTAVSRARVRPRLARCFARTSTLLAIAGLAGCADTLTDPAQQPFPAPQMAVSGSNLVGEYSIPVPPSSLLAVSTVPWTFTGIMVPRTGKYRIRVRGTVNVSQHPSFPGDCTQQPLLTQYLGEWGPMGRPENFGTLLRVGVYTGPAVDFGFPVKIIDAQTIETEQQLEAFTAIWVGRRGVGAQIVCPLPTSPAIPMFALSGSQILTVEEILEPKLECKGADGNTEIERGQTVRCTITPDKPYKVLSRRANITGFTTIAEEPGTSHAANTQYVWEGPAVANTGVQMLIETSEEGGPKQTTHSAAFTVRARDWPKLQLSAPDVLVQPHSKMPAYPAGQVLGVAVPFIPSATLNALPVTLVSSGPNQGLSFLTDPLPTVSHNIYLHPGLESKPSTPPTPDQVWRNDQDGRGDGDCTSSVLGLLRREIERHEGVTQAPNSHWGITARFFREQEFEQRLEEQVLVGDEASLRQQVGSAFRRLLATGPHKEAQTAFDRVDRARVNERLGCKLDYMQNDGG